MPNMTIIKMTLIITLNPLESDFQLIMIRPLLCSEQITIYDDVLSERDFLSLALCF